MTINLHLCVSIKLFQQWNQFDLSDKTHRDSMTNQTARAALRTHKHKTATCSNCLWQFHTQLFKRQTKTSITLFQLNEFLNSEKSWLFAAMHCIHGEPSVGSCFPGLSLNHQGKRKSHSYYQMGNSKRETVIRMPMKECIIPPSQQGLVSPDVCQPF